MAPTNCRADPGEACVSVSRVITYFTFDNTAMSPTIKEKRSLEPTAQKPNSNPQAFPASARTHPIRSRDSSGADDEKRKNESAWGSDIFRSTCRFSRASRNKGSSSGSVSSGASRNPSADRSAGFVPVARNRTSSPRPNPRCSARSRASSGSRQGSRFGRNSSRKSPSAAANAASPGRSPAICQRHCQMTCAQQQGEPISRRSANPGTRGMRLRQQTPVENSRNQSDEAQIESKGNRRLNRRRASREIGALPPFVQSGRQSLSIR